MQLQWSSSVAYVVHQKSHVPAAMNYTLVDLNCPLPFTPVITLTITTAILYKHEDFLTKVYSPLCVTASILMFKVNQFCTGHNI
ncbi:hypothetical protein A2U01_0017168 [Trifolium medium]|uniref:Uncharacterized protein n=1 Tax=Trifolium medium TaxID=97028 RepID=A0A392NAQ2_9FABA|nr:hypothetical protein [Trifolium medium]